MKVIVGYIPDHDETDVPAGVELVTAQDVYAYRKSGKLNNYQFFDCINKIDAGWTLQIVRAQSAVDAFPKLLSLIEASEGTETILCDFGTTDINLQQALVDLANKTETLCVITPIEGVIV